MSAIAKMAALLDKLDSNPIESIFQEEMKSVQSEVVRLQRMQLSRFGINSRGEQIEPAYKPYTVKKKISQGKEADFVTLDDTGKWQRSIKAKVGKTKIQIMATDRKTAMLKRKYGDEILGLTDFNKKVISDMIKPRVVRSLQNYFKR